MPSQIPALAWIAFGITFIDYTFWRYASDSDYLLHEKRDKKAGAHLAETMSGMTKPSYLVRLYCDSYGHVTLMIQTERGPKLVINFIKPVMLGRSEVELDIPKKGIVLENGWSITPIGTTKIQIPVRRRRGMDSRGGLTSEVEPRRGAVLCCTLRVQWTRAIKHPVKLFYEIKLLGANPPANFIPLEIGPPSRSQSKLPRFPQELLQSTYSPSNSMLKRKNPTTEKGTPTDKKRKKED